MNKVYADRARIFTDGWNAAYGNKILHLLFLINFCELRNRQPVVYKGSNLDNLFEFNFNVLEGKEIRIPPYYFKERDPFYKQNVLLRLLRLDYKFYEKNVNIVLKKCYQQYMEEFNLLHERKLPNEDFAIKGHFFEYKLMPSKEVFDKYLEIKNELKKAVVEKYEDILSEEVVAVHYRGTDFSGHLRQIFPKGIKLDKSYYEKSIELIENKLGKNIVFHLFSDELEVLRKYFKGKKVVEHNDSAPMDWVSLFLTKNVIQSNSSFCWTASLFNKNISIQPPGGYNYHLGGGTVPYDFVHEGALVVKNE